jgi:hypothetical protein
MLYMDMLYMRLLDRGFVGASFLLALRLELVDAPLRFDYRRIAGGLLRLARAVAALTAIAVASAAISPATPMLFTLAFRSSAFALGALLLGVWRELVELGRFAARHGRRLLRSLLVRLLRSVLGRLLRRPIGARRPLLLRRPILTGTLLIRAPAALRSIPARLPVPALTVALTLTPAFEAALLLAVAAAALGSPLIPTLAAATTPAAALEAVASAALLVAPGAVALALLLASLLRCLLGLRRNRLVRRGLEQAEDLREEARHGFCHYSDRRGRGRARLRG